MPPEPGHARVSEHRQPGGSGQYRGINGVRCPLSPLSTTIARIVSLSRATGRFLCLSQHTPFVRYIELPEPLSRVKGMGLCACLS